MPSFITSLWIKFQSAIMAVGAFLALAAIIFFRGKAAGREQAETRQREIDDAARKRMEAVKPANSRSTIDSLRKGDF